MYPQSRARLILALVLLATIACNLSGTRSQNEHSTASDGWLYMFMATTTDFPTNTTPLTMHRVDADGLTEPVALRTDSYAVREVLWAEDGSGAVIVDIYDSLLLWLPADGSPAVALPAIGENLRWGDRSDH